MNAERLADLLAVADELEVLARGAPRVLEDPPARRQAAERLLELVVEIHRFDHEHARERPGPNRPRRSSNELLAAARACLGTRLTPAEADQELRSGALLVDIRPVEQRQADGGVPGATVIDRNVLEWRLDPSCPWRHPAVTDHDQRVIVLCNEGYQSSLAAAALTSMGLGATDVIGGFQAWRLSGLPVDDTAG